MVEAPTVDRERRTIDWRHPQSALRDRLSHLRLWLVAGAGLVADLWSKHWAFSSLEVGERRTWVPKVLDVQLSLNPGALFGLGSGMVTLFILASVAALGFVILFFAATVRTQRAVHVALALILAGALGNLYDRTFIRYDLVRVEATGRTVIGKVIDDRAGQTVSVEPWGSAGAVRTFDRSEIDGSIRRVGVVRDFLKISPRLFGRQIWPWVFNVADAMLVAGVGLLLVNLRIRARRLRSSAATDSDDLGQGAAVS